MLDEYQFVLRSLIAFEIKLHKIRFNQTNRIVLFYQNMIHLLLSLNKKLNYF